MLLLLLPGYSPQAEALVSQVGIEVARSLTTESVVVAQVGVEVAYGLTVESAIVAQVGVEMAYIPIISVVVAQAGIEVAFIRSGRKYSVQHI